MGEFASSDPTQTMSAGSAGLPSVALSVQDAHSNMPPQVCRTLLHSTDATMSVLLCSSLRRTPYRQTLRLSSLVIFLATGFIAVATFKDIAGLSRTKPIALWIVYYIFNAVCIVLYLISQLILVVRTLDDKWWPIGDILFGLGFFVIGQVLIYGFSIKICNSIKHYLDGLFFGSLCTLLTVMMIYKYYDTITKEDLEFSVGSKQAVWEVKESLLSGGGGGGGYQAFDDDDFASSKLPAFSHPQAQQGYASQTYGNYGGQQHYGMQGYPPSKGAF